MGGAAQPQMHAQIVMNIVDFGMNVQEAGDAPRILHLGSSQPTGETMTDGGTVYLETGFPAETVRELVKMGHTIGHNVGDFGGYQAIRYDGEDRRLLRRQRIPQGRPGRRLLRRTAGLSSPREEGTLDEVTLSMVHERRRPISPTTMTNGASPSTTTVKLFEMLVLEGSAGRAELADDSQETRQLPRRLRQLRSGEGRPLRRWQDRTAPARPRHRPQSAQSRVGRAKCSGLPGRPKRVRLLRCVPLALRRGNAEEERLDVAVSDPGPSTKESDALGKDLKQRGFNFVGSTICYAYHAIDRHGQRPCRRTASVMHKYG